MAGQDLLSYEVSEFARTLAGGTAVGEVLDGLAERITALPGLTGAGVPVLESGLIRFTAATASGSRSSPAVIPSQAACAQKGPLAAPV